VVVRVLAGQFVGLGLGEELDALVADEVVFDPEDLTGGVDPAVSGPPPLRVRT
jgi:hypothetical protein